MDFKEEIIKSLKKEINAEINLEIPPDSNLGDYAFPCFNLAKIYKKNPVEIASELSKKIKNDNFKTENNGPYLNFFVDRKKFAYETIKSILDKKYKLHKKGKKVLVEYCDANTHKAFHVGHTRNICIGEAISRTLEYIGNKVIRVNYQGDIGMHVAKAIYGLLNLKKLNLKKPGKNKGKWLGLVYAAASNLAKNDEKTTEEINEINQKLYAGDKNITKIWKESKKWSIEYFEKTVYPDFNVKFNRFYFESEVEKDGVKIARTLLENNYAELNDGAIIVDLKKYNLGIFLILKSDGNPLYSTKDLALAELQNKEFKPDIILHIVGAEQNLYFKQLIKTIEIYNKDLSNKEKHVSYELVNGSDGKKFASREGKIILYDDTLEEMISYAKREIKIRNSKVKERELNKKAKIIALSAIKYSMLSQDPKKVIVFDAQKSVSFEGDTGPYLLYSYARSCSILKKIKNKKIKLAVNDINDSEYFLINKLSKFQEIVLKACDEFDVSLITRYSFELCKLFNEFYHSSQVIGSGREEFLIYLVKSFNEILKESLNILSIEVMEEM